MNRLFFLLVIFLTLSFPGSSQYHFTNDILLDATPVKNQARTGTCWSFATASFLESELLRTANVQVDLSEMFVVRNIYKDKARNYILRQGKANFSQGSLAHDLINIAAKYGLMPESVYSGLMPGDNSHDHFEMERGLKGFLDGVLEVAPLSAKWDEAFESILDAYLGPSPEEFDYEGRKYTPRSFADHLGIQPQKFISLTSFTHHPFGETFILEIPDNYSNGSFYNVSLDELVRTIDSALENGFTVAWDGDVSENGFSAQEGMAVLPRGPVRPDLFKTPGEEMVVSQALRQEHFENLSTTDDHLMHIVGTAHDQNGIKYYIVKNSWGQISDYKGYLYMSESYARMKTVFIMINADALNKDMGVNLKE